jgi:putative nucleotidyltransferase with HDIG domain
MVISFNVFRLKYEILTVGHAAEIIAGIANGFILSILLSGVIPIIEAVFGYTTDIKLLELANLDHPLLKELPLHAPGTYQHAIIVGSMVEEAAKAIHANPLLARVSSYYHDIGKIKKPLYFIENQREINNKHDKLSPNMSSLILISHLRDGVELAKEYKLGKKIIDIIKQHHGTGLIKYFYEKAKALEKDSSYTVDEKDFRYPGPKPQTKEAGLVLLADVVEAAAKTLPEFTSARVQGLVQKMINKVFSDGQLDECELTLKDLNEIAKAFNRILNAIYHQRVDYPELAYKQSERKQKANGSAIKKQPQKDTDKSKEDEEKDKENLKRLGLYK